MNVILKLDCIVGDLTLELMGSSSYFLGLLLSGNSNFSM